MSFLCLVSANAEHRANSHDYYSTDYSSSINYPKEQNAEYFTFSDGMRQQILRLSDIQEVWDTETRQVRSTCTRQVPVTRRVCRDSSHRGYHPPRRHPRRGRHYRAGYPPRQSCRTETSYRTERYTCYKTENVRVRRPDRRFHANVDVRFKEISSNGNGSYSTADFIATLNKNTLAIQLQRQEPRGSKLFFMKQKLNTQRHGNVTEISGTVKILVFDKREFLKPVRQNIEIRPDVHHGELVMKTGKIVFQRGLKISLEVIGEYGRTLFRGKVPKDLLTIRDRRYGGESIITINIERLLRGTLRRGERAEVFATVSLVPPKFELLNYRRVPQLEQSTRSYISVR